MILGRKNHHGNWSGVFKFLDLYVTHTTLVFSLPQGFLFFNFFKKHTWLLLATPSRTSKQLLIFLRWWCGLLVKVGLKKRLLRLTNFEYTIKKLPHMELHVKKIVYQLVNNVKKIGNFQSSRIQSRNNGNRFNKD
jgi:hypothetical protein